MKKIKDNKKMKFDTVHQVGKWTVYCEYNSEPNAPTFENLFLKFIGNYAEFEKKVDNSKITW